MSLGLNMRNTWQKNLLEPSHLKPLSEVFSEELLETTPIDNKVGGKLLWAVFRTIEEKGWASI